MKDNRPNLEIPDPPGLLSTREDLEPDQMGCKFHFCEVVGIEEEKTNTTNPLKQTASDLSH